MLKSNYNNFTVFIRRGWPILIDMDTVSSRTMEWGTSA